MMTIRTLRPAATLAGTLLVLGTAASAPAGVSLPEYLGPEPYTSSADSPFDTDGFGFCIEDFENGKFDVPGASGDGAIVGPGSLADSVDADDGAIDGSGTSGRSYFSGNGPGGITITFDPERANGLPTNVGIVWTDSGFGATVTFEAFNAEGESVLPAAFGPFLHSDNSNTGDTAEDRFYGIVHSGGISKIRISNSSGGIEVDHLQLNKCHLCGDTDTDLDVSASDALSVLRTAVGSEDCQLCICDTNGNGEITVADALAALRASVGLGGASSCPSCPLPV